MQSNSISQGSLLELPVLAQRKKKLQAAVGMKQNYHPLRYSAVLSSV